MRSSPPLGLLRVLRPIPRPWVGNGPAHLRAGCPGGGRPGDGSHVHLFDHSFREVPSYIPVASPRLRRRPSPWPPARPLQPGPELTTRLHERGGWLRATDRPVSTRFEPAPRLRDFNHWFTCVAPSDLAGRTRIVWSCRYVPPLSGLLPALAGVPRIGLPPASARRCDGLPVESFHLHMVKWRLVAHVKSVRGAVPVFRPARFPGPLPEPAVRLSPQRALRKPQSGSDRPLVQLGLDLQYPSSAGRERFPDRRCSPTQPPDLPDFRCWLTGPAG